VEPVVGPPLVVAPGVPMGALALAGRVAQALVAVVEQQ